MADQRERTCSEVLRARRRDRFSVREIAADVPVTCRVYFDDHSERKS